MQHQTKTMFSFLDYSQKILFAICIDSKFFIGLESFFLLFTQFAAKNLNFHIIFNLTLK